MAMIYKTRLKVWTGPTIVNAIASAMSAAGLHVECAGTEHVYVDVPHDGEAFEGAFLALRAALIETHATDFGYSTPYPHVQRLWTKLPEVTK
jgi:hypothetical protein